MKLLAQIAALGALSSVISQSTTFQGTFHYVEPNWVPMYDCGDISSSLTADQINNGYYFGSVPGSGIQCGQQYTFQNPENGIQITASMLWHNSADGVVEFSSRAWADFRGHPSVAVPIGNDARALSDFQIAVEDARIDGITAYPSGNGVSTPGANNGNAPVGNGNAPVGNGNAPVGNGNYPIVGNVNAPGAVGGVSSPGTLNGFSTPVTVPENIGYIPPSY